MSGEATVTPGKVWATEDVDAAKLALTATPTVRVDEDAITERELIGTELIETFADAFRRKNHFANPVLWGPYWNDDAAPITCPIAGWTENAAGWQVRATGATVDYSQLEETPAANPKNKFAAKVTGQVGCTGAEFTQFISPDIGRQLGGKFLAASLQCKTSNGAQDDLTAELWICTAEGDYTTLAFEEILSGPTPTIQGDGWAHWEFENDDSKANDLLEKGFAIIFVISQSTVNGAGEYAAFTQMQLEVDVAAATTFINPVDPERQHLDFLVNADNPHVGSDVESIAARPGALWMDTSDSAKIESYLAINTDPGVANWRYIGRDFPECFMVYETQPTTTAGGTFTSGADRTRVLNAISPADSRWTLSANQITLAPGHYRVEGFAPGSRVGRNIAHLYNVTGTAILVQGQNCRAVAGATNQELAPINGTFFLSAQSVIELRHRAETTRTTSGFGVPNSFGGAEIYSHLVFTVLPWSDNIRAYSYPAH